MCGYLQLTGIHMTCACICIRMLTDRGDGEPFLSIMQHFSITHRWLCLAVGRVSWLFPCRIRTVPY